MTTTELDAGAVTVAYVHDNELASSFHQSLMALIGYDLANEGRIARGGWIAERYSTGGLPSARNLGVQEFLAKSSAEWLFWVDSDMGFAPDTIDQLVAAADPETRPIVGALCFRQWSHISDGAGGWRPKVGPVIMNWYDSGDGVQGFKAADHYPANTLVRCAGTGSACILIHRSVFERIRDQFGPEWYDQLPGPGWKAEDNLKGSPRLISEDLSFCVRANALDIPVFVHTGVKTTHLKNIWISEQDYLDQTWLRRDRLPEGRTAPLPEELTEARWTLPRDDCPNPERWHSTDVDSTEIEVSEFIGGWIVALQPDLVLETGTAFGQTAELIGRALVRNGHGRLVTLEVDDERVAYSRNRCKSLPVEVLQQSSLDYVPEEPVDFAFFDSLVHLRPQEFRNWLPFMHERTVVGFHDTGPHHHVRRLIQPLIDEGLISPIFLPTPRGVCFATVNPKGGANGDHHDRRGADAARAE